MRESANNFSEFTNKGVATAGIIPKLHISSKLAASEKTSTVINVTNSQKSTPTAST